MDVITFQCMLCKNLQNINHLHNIFKVLKVLVVTAKGKPLIQLGRIQTIYFVISWCVF